MELSVFLTKVLLLFIEQNRDCIFEDVTNSFWVTSAFQFNLFELKLTDSLNSYNQAKNKKIQIYKSLTSLAENKVL